MNVEMRVLRRSWLRPRRRAAVAGKTDLVMTISAAVVILWICVAVAAPLISPQSPTFQELTERLRPPSWSALFGTDVLGRDVFSRVIYGARASLLIAAAAVGIAAVVGITLGVTAGWIGGWVDTIITRVADIMLSFPAMLLALAVAAFLGPGLVNVALAIAAFSWPAYCRLMRGEVMSHIARPHVVSARALGCSEPRVLVRHVLPFCWDIIFVKLTLDAGMAILIASGLSFVGVGAVPPTPEWGSMLADSRLNLDSWWLSVFPGVALLSLTVAFNLAGDSLRDAVDPTGRRR